MCGLLSIDITLYILVDVCANEYIAFGFFGEACFTKWAIEVGWREVEARVFIFGNEALMRFLKRCLRHGESLLDDVWALG